MGLGGFDRGLIGVRMEGRWWLLAMKGWVLIVCV